MTFPATGYPSNAARTEGEMKTFCEDLLRTCKQIPGAGLAEQALTIATGVITPAASGASNLIVDTEGAAATDDLTNITQTNTDDGQCVMLRCASSARVVVIKHAAGGTGQITLKTSGDFTLADTARHWLLLKRVGTVWLEVARFPSADHAPVLPKTAPYTTTVSDRGQPIDCTANTFTVTLLPAVSAGRGFEQPIKNTGTGIITVDGNAAETIDGAATVVLFPGDSMFLLCDGTNWKSLAYWSNSPLIQAKTANYTVVNADRQTVIDGTSGTFTLTLTAAATLGASFKFTARNSGTGVVTIDANAAETIDGAQTVVLRTGQSVTLLCDGSNWKSTATNHVITLGTMQTTVSGTTKDFTEIPAGVKKITVSLNGVSVSGTSIMQVQLGDAGGVETTGYLGMVSGGNGAATAANLSAGFLLTGSGVAAGVIHGTLHLTLVDPATNLWSAIGSFGNSDTAVGPVALVAGSKALSAVLTQVRLTTVNGTDTFDLGNVNVTWE